MAEDTRNLRIEERLKIKIAEAKCLPARNHGTYCVLTLDQEEIFRTSTVEKTKEGGDEPFFGEEFQFDVPRPFRSLCVYVYERERDRHLRHDKVLGKVAIRREDLTGYSSHDHWFALKPVDHDSEVQGKAHIKISICEPALPTIRTLEASPKTQRTNHKQDVTIEDNRVVLRQNDDSVDRKTKHKKISDYYKDGMKFGSNRKITDNVSPILGGLSRSESLRNAGGNLIQNQVQNHNTYGPSSSRGKHASLNCPRNYVVASENAWSSYDKVENPYVSMESQNDSAVYTSLQPDLKNKLSITILECSELSRKNGQCDPYAVVSVLYSNNKKISKKTKVKKKTVNPHFDESFEFDLTLEGDSIKDREGSNNAYRVCPADVRGEAAAVEICVSLWHDAPGMGSGALFLGEVRASLSGQLTIPKLNTQAWYCLTSRSGGPQHARLGTPPGTRLSSACAASLGSLRLVLQYAEDRVLPEQAYDRLRTLLTCPAPKITSSPVYILGELISCKNEELHQPLVQLFTHAGQLVQLVKALADAELAPPTDPTTIFRGNTLVSKMMDSAMRLTGQAYLQQTLQPSIEAILQERRPCEIDPARAKDSNIEPNLNNLKDYVEKIFDAITSSFIHCPFAMCRLFDCLRQAATSRFPGNPDVRYSVVSGFIFLRFFAPAILNPRMFGLTTEHIDPQSQRTLKLISKTIQSLGNLLSSQPCKEKFMQPLYSHFSTETHVQAVKRFLEIISSSKETQNCSAIQETPVLLKEGTMCKKVHSLKGKSGRGKMGMPGLKQRYFRLTSCDLSYSKAKGKKQLCSISLADIRTVWAEPGPHNLTTDNMFLIEYKDKMLEIRASNCLEQKEWLDLLGKLCEAHRGQATLTTCRPGEAPQPLPPQVCQLRLDPARDLQRIHCLLLAQLEAIEDTLSSSKPNPRFTPEALVTLKQLKEVTYNLQDQHRICQRNMDKETTEYGSKQAPIGDDNYLHLAARSDMTAEGRQSLLPSRGYPISVGYTNMNQQVSPVRGYLTRPSLAPRINMADLQKSLPLPPSVEGQKMSMPLPVYTNTSTEDQKIIKGSPAGVPPPCPRAALPPKPSQQRLHQINGEFTNRLYVGESDRSVGSEEKTLGIGDASASGYLKMTSVKQDQDNGEKITKLIIIESKDAAGCEYVEVRPKVPERESKPKLNAPQIKVPSLEEQADNVMLSCAEYEVMANFTSSAKNPASLPPAVPPRVHPGSSKWKSEPVDVLREHKALEHYQLKTAKCDESFENDRLDTVLRIVEAEDVISSSEEQNRSTTEGQRSHNDNCNEEIKHASASEVSEKTTETETADSVKENPLSLDSKKHSGKTKEDGWYFSRKSTQRKSKSEKKKDEAAGSSKSPPFTERITPSFLKRKTKVNTDAVRILQACQR